MEHKPVRKAYSAPTLTRILNPPQHLIDKMAELRGGSFNKPVAGKSE